MPPKRKATEAANKDAAPKKVATAGAAPVDASAKRRIVFLGYGCVARSAIAIASNWHDGELWGKFGATEIIVLAKDFTADDEKELANYGIKGLKTDLTQANYVEVLTPYFAADKKRGFEPSLVFNLTCGVSSLAIVKLGQETGALILDTSASELWPEEEEALVKEDFGEVGSNYWCREKYWDYAKTRPAGSPTVLTCMGANPGMVTLFVKKALATMWGEAGNKTKPETVGWAQVAQKLGVRTIHIAERDTSKAKKPRKKHEFRNTWSVDGFILEGAKQCADLGWGSHEKKLPPKGHEYSFGTKCAIRVAEASAGVKCWSYVPTFGEQVVCCVTHYEASSIPDWLTVKDAKDKVVYRPTCHYAYRCCEDAYDAMAEMEANDWKPCHSMKKVYSQEEIKAGGVDELGVLLCTTAKENGTVWYGSTASIEDAIAVAPVITGTSIQIASGVLVGGLWLLRNPAKGLCEPEDIEDYELALSEAAPFLGKVHMNRSSWTPRGGDPTDDNTWQFNNLRATPEEVAKFKASLK